MLLRLCFSCLIFACYMINNILANNEIWPDVVSNDREEYPKPTSWANKNYGQWCRNQTIGRHIQCQMGSVLHLYTCCGETGTECCFQLQPTATAYLLSMALLIVISSVFYLLLKFNIVCPIENPREMNEYSNSPKSG
ncbi:unnamed protein product [Thelazia callipaeda]|uniref:CX domain-containing protein n=1 Tax=Thelazia callipaeda TaxID=103827 RepID=A0A0N5DBC6_THECL|nr:unnamed protein product [Thelazia callipaeda]